MECTFEGTSDRGDFSEALSRAIVAAKDGLKTDRVAWRLEEVSGVDGGFIPDREVTIRILAKNAVT